MKKNVLLIKINCEQLSEKRTIENMTETIN